MFACTYFPTFFEYNTGSLSNRSQRSTRRWILCCRLLTPTAILEADQNPFANESIRREEYRRWRHMVGTEPSVCISDRTTHQCASSSLPTATGGAFCAGFETI